MDELGEMLALSCPKLSKTDGVLSKGQAEPFWDQTWDGRVLALQRWSTAQVEQMEVEQPGRAQLCPSLPSFKSQAATAAPWELSLREPGM